MFFLPYKLLEIIAASRIVLYHEKARPFFDAYVRQGMFTQLGTLLSTVVHIYIVGRKKGLGTNLIAHLAIWGGGAELDRSLSNLIPDPWAC
jgi:hypothetical protein